MTNKYMNVRAHCLNSNEHISLYTATNFNFLEMRYKLCSFFFRCYFVATIFFTLAFWSTTTKAQVAAAAVKHPLKCEAFVNDFDILIWVKYHMKNTICASWNKVCIEHGRVSALLFDRLIEEKKTSKSARWRSPETNRHMKKYANYTFIRTSIICWFGLVACFITICVHHALCTCFCVFFLSFISFHKAYEIPVCSMVCAAFNVRQAISVSKGTDANRQKRTNERTSQQTNEKRTTQI